MKALVATLIFCLCIFSSATFARDEVQTFSLDEVMSLEDTKAALGSDIQFFFGHPPAGEVEQIFGEFGSNKKTNAFNKSDLQACQRAFLSAMLSLRDRARREGGNAVINIKSNYKSNESSSETEFACGAGNVVAGVALRGTVVKLK